MAFDDAVIGNGSSFDPREATESLIRQVNDIPSGGTVDVRLLATRLARKLGQEAPPDLSDQPPLPKPRPAAADAPPPVPRRRAPPPATTSAPLDFSSQAVPPSPTDGTNTGLDFSAQATEAVPLPAPRPLEAPQPPATSLSDYPIEFGKGVLEGGKNMGAAALKGVAGAGIPSVADPALLDDLARAPTMTPGQRAQVMSRVMTTVSDRGLQMDFNAALRRVSQGGDPAAEIAALRPKFDANNATAAQPVTAKPLYQAGHAIEEFGKEALAPRPGFEPGVSWTRDIGSGAGSMVAGIWLSMVPGIGPAAAGTLFTTAGMGEAVDKAVKGGATPQQTALAAKLGGVAGATDMVDTLLPMLGSTGKALGFIKRMGVAAIKGALIEGGQEGVQQLMQNAIAKGIYKPDQDMFEDVPRSMAIAAILGGVAGGASAIRKPAPPTASSTAAPGGPAPGGGPASGPGPSSPGGERSSPEDIDEFLRRAKEGAPPPPEPGPPPGPDPSTMSEAERQQAFIDARDAFGGASVDEILRAYGWDETSVAQMGEQDKIDQAIKAGHEKRTKTGKFAGDAESSADGTAQAEHEAEPQAQQQAQPEQPTAKAKPEPASHLEYAVLREYGYSAEDIENMSPAQRKRDVQDAYAGGIKPGEAMMKHQPPKAATSESDAGTGTRVAPIKVASADDVLKAKPAEPTPAQATAENYRHAHVELDHLGLSGKNSISVETGVGQERSGIGADGKPWKVKLDHAAYGRIKGTKGADGQPLDVFVGPHPTSQHVFVVDQHHPGGGFDEHKIMAGFNTPIDALHAYANSYNDQAKDRIGHVTAMTPDQFKEWLKTDTTKPLKPPTSEPVKAEAGGSASTEAPGTSASVPKESPAAGAAVEAAGSKPATPRPAKGSDQPLSLLEFVASKGGLAPHAELDALDVRDHRSQIPGRKGFFGVVRPTGMSLDMMREAAEEAGYLRGEHNKTSTVRDFLDALDNELRGQRHAAQGEEGHKTKRQRTSEAESSAAARDQAIAAAHDDIAAEYADLPADLHAKAAEIMADERLDVDSAVEMAAIRMVNEDADYGVTESDIKQVYGEGAIDEIRPRQASEDGRDVAPTSGQEQRSGEGEEAGQHGERVSDAGAERSAQEGEGERAHEKAIEAALDTIEEAVEAGNREVVLKAAREARRVLAGVPQEVKDGAEADYWKQFSALINRMTKPGYVTGKQQALADTGEWWDGLTDAERKPILSEAGLSDARSPLGKYSPNVIWEGLPAEPRERLLDWRNRQKPETEKTEAGEQTVLPGAEKIGDGELAQRKADTGLKPRVAQKPADVGLFSDERDQGDLLNVPAVREELFVQIDGRRYPLTSYKAASEAYRGALEQTGATVSGETGPKAPQPVIVNEKGEVVGHISQNGRVWQGRPEDQFDAAGRYVGQPLLYDPRAEPEIIEPYKSSPEVMERARNLQVVPPPRLIEHQQSAVDDLLTGEGYKLIDEAEGRRTYHHNDDAGSEQFRAIGKLLRSLGWEANRFELRALRHPDTNEIIELEPGGEDTSGHYLHHMDGSAARLGAEDSDEAVTARLTKEGPWDFNDTWPAPDMEMLAGAEREGRSYFGEGRPSVQQVVELVDEGMNGITSAIAQIREIDSRIADIRAGKTKLKKRQTPQQAIDALQHDRGLYAAEVRDTAAAYEEIFGRPAANAMIVEARKRLVSEGRVSPGPRHLVPLTAIEDALGEDADKVAPVDIARAAELLDENEGMDPATAFGQAVIENAVDHGFISEAEAVEAYGEEVKTVLDAGREGAFGSGADLEQGSAPSGEVSPGGAAQTGVVSSRGEDRGQGEGGADSTSAIPATSGTAASGSEAAGDQAGDAIADRPAAKGADDANSLVADQKTPTLQAGETDGIPASVHAGDAPAGADDVQPAQSGEDAAGARRREGAGSEPDVRGTDEGRAQREGRVSEGAAGERSDRSGDGGADRVSGSRADDAADGREKRAAQRAANVEGENFTIEPGALDEARSPLKKARDNIAAIIVAQQVEAEGRPATRGEQEFLARYVGWGGIKGAFPDTDGKFAKGFESVGEQIVELLDKTEYDTARRSIQYAHYTSEAIVRAMWRAVGRMGFKEGQVFEPGMGVGNFAGMMPADIAANSQYVGLELDHITARIAKLLYPKYGVRRDDFTTAPLPENNYDLIIGNPPFADIPVKSDPKYRQGFLLHDYFLAKSIDAVRPGGLLAFVTSAGTMNKADPAARNYVADRADLVGAIRLPGDAFKQNAGTEVTTDILFLRKRLPGDVAGDRSWTEVVETTLPNRDGMKITGNVSSYFAAHPEMVLGEQGFFDKLYQNRYAVRARKGADTEADLQKAIQNLPADVMSAWQDVNTGHAEQDFVTTERKEGTFYLGPNGALHQVVQGVGRPVGQRGKGVENGRTAADMERIKALIPVRDSLRAVYAADLKGDAANGDRARQALNKHYDAFVEQFGPINKAVIQTRRPNVIQYEAARAEAREEARYAGAHFKEGSFDATPLLDAKTPLSVIARKRQEARDDYAKKYLNFDEGSFDPDEVPDVIIDKRPNVDPFMDDPESYRLRAIERYDEGSGKGYKSPVFFENVITRTQVPQINSVNDALLYSLSQFGRVNVPEIARLAKKSEGQVVEELGEQVFRQPGTTDVYQTRGEYLSGDVRKKLAVAQKAADKNPDFRRNVAALEAAQPMPLAPSQIHATLGMPWIPVDVVQEFGTRELGLEKLKVRYIPALAQWIVSGDTDSVAATSTWGTSDRRAPALISDALNRQNPKIYDKYHDENGRERSIINVVKTEAAQDKIRAIQDKFRDWIWSDTERSDRLAGHYNENFNNLVVREYDGDYLTTPGVASNWTWRPHQKRVIARIIQSGNTYIAHAVGAGKTSEYIGAVMEKRRLGLARKPMIVVPNHMLAQFTKEFYEQYPMARLAIADDRRFHTDRRKQFIANVATDDLDAIIITHSAFGMIPMSENFANAIVEAEINQYRELLGQIGSGGEARITRSRIEKQIERLQQRLVGRASRRRDQVFTFEEMGVDDLTIDEAHLFRKLDFSTNMSSLKGITPEGSGMAWDLYVKTRYLESIKPGRGLTLGSGTPITNTMAELFTVSRFMQPQALAERGLEKFDAWAGAFGESVSELEQDAAGNYKPVSRFAKFVNVAELSAMVRQIMDVVTSKQLEQYVTRPKIAGGKRKLHLSEKSPELERYQAELARRMEVIQKRKGPPKKGDDIMLSVINDGRHAAIDMRLAGGSPSSNIQSKLDDMIDNIFETWQRTKKTKFYKPAQGGSYETTPAFEGPATQLVFINLGLSGARGFSVPDHIRAELVRRGVPKDEIAYIYDYKSQTAKQRLFNDMNEGKKRIMMGSVAKMGIGTNVQRRLKAIHNQDALWYPSDDEQRNGRGLRQGNMNPELEINDYATKGTYDSTMWGMMEKKARFIQGFFEGDPSLREMDDLGEASQYEQAKALTTNDPRLIRFTELKQDLERANRRKTAFDSDTYATRQRRARSKSEAEHYTQRITETEKDIAQRVETAGDKFNASIGKVAFTKRAEFGDALFEKLADVEAKGTLNTAIKVAEVGGFGIYASTRKSLIDKKNTVDVYLLLNGEREREVSYGVSALGTVRSIESILHGLDSDLETYKGAKARAEKFYAESEKQANAKFQGDAEIEALTEQVRALHAELSKPAEKPAPPQAAETEEEPESARLANLKLLPEHKHAAVEQAVRTFLTGILGSHVKVEFHSGGIQVSDQARQKWGDLAEGRTAVGVYNSTQKLVKLALTDGIDRAAFHEAYHASRDLLMTPVERAFMDRQNAALRDWVQKKRGYTDAEIRGLDNEEVEAIGAEEYMAERVENSGQGLHIGVRRFFRRLMDHLRKLANAIRGLGYQSYNDIYADLFEGKHGEREANAGADNERASFGPGGRRGPPPVSETIAQHLEDRNFPRLAKISRALGLGRINTTELRVQLQDKFIRVRDTERMVDPALASSQSAYQAESLYYGRTGEQLETLEREHFDPLITDMKARGIDLEGINEYLYARHAPERNRRMDEINHPELDPGGRDLRGRGSGMSDDEALAVLDRITAEGKMADYEAIERRIRTILDNTRQGLVDSGLISQETADAWAAQYEFYVPLRGFEEGTEDESMSGRGAGFDTRARETQQAFGRLSKAAGPLPYIMQQAEMAIVRGEKNRVGNAWLRFVRSHPMPDRWAVDTPPTKKAIDKRTGLVTTVQDQNWHLKPDIFVTKIGGKPVLIQMKGKDGENVVRALKNMGTSNLNTVLRFMNALTSTMSRLATQWNPNFTVPNFARDVGEAFINLQAQDQATFVKRFSKHLFPAIKGSFHALRGASGGTYGDAFREFDKAGGRIRFFGLENHDDVEKNINQRLRRLQGGAINNIIGAGEAAAHGFEIVNGAIENATRLAAFMAARDVGMNTRDAAMLARNLTVDFNKKGELGAAINALYMFANASIQGSVRVASAMTHKRVRRAAYLLAVAGALGALANILGGGDDEDGVPYYSKIRSYIRDKHMIIMWPKGFGNDGAYIKIPLPYGFSPFHVLGDRLAGVTLGKDKPGAAAWAVLASIAEAFNPLGEESATVLSVVPSIFRPAAHIQTNTNWTGNPIYPKRDFEKNKPESEQYFPSNSQFSKDAARAINKATGGSPYKAGWVDWHPGSIDHTMESLTGGLGKFLRDVIFTGTGIYSGDPFDATKAPILRRFYGKVKDPATIAASYYEAREEARKNGGDALKNARKDRARGINTEDAESFLKSNTNSIRGEQIFKSADSAMKPLRERMDRVKANTTLDAAEKRRQLTEITEQMSRIQMGARKQYLELSKGAGAP